MMNSLISRFSAGLSGDAKVCVRVYVHSSECGCVSVNMYLARDLIDRQKNRNMTNEVN